MSRFDFTGYVQQRDEAAERQRKAERDRENQRRDTWVELKREAANYVQRNGASCQVAGDYPKITLNTGSSKSLVITVKDRSTFEVNRIGDSDPPPPGLGDPVQEISGDQGLMRATVGWYEMIRSTAW